MRQEYSLSQETKYNFYRSGLVYLFFLLGFLALEIVFWKDSTITAFQKNITIPLFMLISLRGLVANFYNRLHEKIIISDEGIEYQALGVNIYAKWNQVMIMENWGFRKVDVIPVGKRNIKRNLIGAIGHYDNSIPIFRFGTKWRNTDLGKQIKKYAPQLFNQAAE
jgi:hypothetical protein